MDTHHTKRKKTNESTAEPVVEQPIPVDYTKTDIYLEALPGMGDSLKTIVSRMKEAIIEERKYIDDEGKEKTGRSLIIPKSNSNEKDTLVGINTNRLLVSASKIARFGMFYDTGSAKYYDEKLLTKNGRRMMTFRILPPMDWISQSEKYQKFPGMIDAYIKQNVCLLIIIKSVIEEFVNKMMLRPELFVLELGNWINESCDGLYTLKEIGQPNKFIEKYVKDTSPKEQERFKIFLNNLRKNVLPATECAGLKYQDILDFLDRFFGEFENTQPMIERVKKSLGTVDINGKTAQKVLYIKSTCKTYVTTKTKVDNKDVTTEVPYFPEIQLFQRVHDPVRATYVNKTVTIPVNVDMLERDRDNLTKNKVPENMLFPIGLGDAVIVGGVIIVCPKPDEGDKAHPKLTIRMTRLTRMNTAPPIPTNTASGYIENDLMNDFNDFEDYDQNSSSNSNNNHDIDPPMDTHPNDSPITAILDY